MPNLKSVLFHSVRKSNGFPVNLLHLHELESKLGMIRLRPRAELEISQNAQTERNGERMVRQFLLRLLSSMLFFRKKLLKVVREENQVRFGFRC
jgi:hypothetical protein